MFITVELDEPWGIFSDVYDASYNGNATMDTIFVDLNSRYRDPSGATETDFADVLINMMTVTYFRYDGSTDVPEPFTYYIQNGNVPAGGVLNLEIPVVLQKAKWESPLEELAFGGGEGTISMQAQVDFYGADVAGNSVHCNVTLNINASDY